MQIDTFTELAGKHGFSVTTYKFEDPNMSDEIMLGMTHTVGTYKIDCADIERWDWGGANQFLETYARAMTYTPSSVSEDD